MSSLDKKNSLRSVQSKRGDSWVFLFASGKETAAEQTLRSMLSTTPANVPLVVVSATKDRDHHFARQIDKEPQVMFVHADLSYAEAFNQVVDIVEPADIVVIEAGCIVPSGWLERLCAAAYADSITGSATALSDASSFLRVLSPNLSLENADRAIMSHSAQLRPRIPTGLPHCILLKRSGLELAGNADEELKNVSDVIVDITQRMQSQGLKHVAVDDLWVKSAQVLPAKSELEFCISPGVQQRYPYLDEALNLAEGKESTLQRSLDIARRAVTLTTIAIDGTRLDADVTGTQLHILELATAMSSQPGINIRLIIPELINCEAKKFLDAFPQITQVSIRQAGSLPPADIIHRPFQISYRGEVDVLRRLGRRLVVTHQDLIGYGNPSYYPTPAAWAEYLEVTATSLARVDAVVTFSQHVADNLVAEGLSEPNRTWAVAIGVDHHFQESLPEAQSPPDCNIGEQDNLLLCLGNDFRHKNRVFAIRVLQQLLDKHKWKGHLVLAGPHVMDGSSQSEEEALLVANPKLVKAVVRLSAVTMAEKRWLFEHAKIVLYPTSIEGFGLIPFEAADYGVPCMFPLQASLGELFSPEVALLTPWDVKGTAQIVSNFCSDPAKGQAQVAAILRIGKSLTWDKTAKQLLGVYREILSRPPKILKLEPEPQISVAHSDIPADIVASLSAIARRPRIAIPFFNALRMASRLVRYYRKAR